MVSVSEAIEQSRTYLSSAAALESIQRDPYWPKWDSPWWHMVALHEMGLAHEIPSPAVQKMVEVLKTHYLPVFPVTADEFPEGTDPYRRIACFCAIGSIYQVLFACGVDVDRELPWIKQWFFKYQLPDGGLNCDERAYVKATPKSSIVSTLPCLEAVLFCRKNELTDEEVAFLNRGATYLLRQKLFRKVSTGEVADPDWLEARFPRFYDYDFLRGFYFLEKWRQQSGFSIPDALVDEVEELVARQMTPEGIKLKRYNLLEKKSYNPQPDGSWAFGVATESGLLKAVSFDGAICEPLTKKWNEVKPRTATVTESYQVAYPNPIKLKVGESVRIEKRETRPEWLGWVYCIDERGIGGWVSEKYLNEDGATAVVAKDYDATELAVTSGETVKVYYEEFGWCWSRNAKGDKGWVPMENLSGFSK